MKKNDIKASKAEESEVLTEARRLFNRKLEQHVRRSTVSAPKMPE
jgi:hypothetical protein